MQPGFSNIMDRGVKISIAATIVLGGATLALLVRRDLPTPLAAKPAEQLLLRDPAASHQASPARPPAHPRATTATLAPAGQPRRRPAEAAAPARSLPSWLAAAPRDARPRRHRVADGDSLTLLAKRYLGSAQRQWEIFEANRDVLASPGLLPIGAELKIPPSGPAPPPVRPGAGD